MIALWKTYDERLSEAVAQIGGLEKRNRQRQPGYFSSVCATVLPFVQPLHEEQPDEVLVTQYLPETLERAIRHQDQEHDEAGREARIQRRTNDVCQRFHNR